MIDRAELISERSRTPRLESRPIDVSAWIGGYPFREVPHPEPCVLVRVLEREGYGGAWVGALPGAFHRDPVPSNRWLISQLAQFREMLHPAPIVRPDWPGWEAMLRMAVDEGAPAVRVYPAQWGYSPGHPALAELAYACGEAGVVLHITTRFEDGRQLHTMDGAGDVGAATLRALARLVDSRCHIVVAGSGRDLIEEIHWGLTPPEQVRVWYDYSWVWGPPEDHFAHLLSTMGAARFAWSSWWPLRLAGNSRSLVELLPAELRSSAADENFADGRAISQAAARSSLHGG